MSYLAPSQRTTQTNPNAAPTHCAGCHFSFESYGMKPADGYTQGGKTYCNSDCQQQRRLPKSSRVLWICSLRTNGKHSVTFSGGEHSSAP
ncbi:hypothetical protein P4S73_28990 [Paraglaciecola sp. Hal342]